MKKNLRKNSFLRPILSIWCLLIGANCFAQVTILKSPEKPKIGEDQKQEDNKPVKRIKLQNFFKDKTKLKDPFSLRDPFKAPSRIIEREKKKKASMYKGVFTNLPTIETLAIEDLKVTGVLIGKERRAMALMGDNVILLKEGMKIGEDQAEIKAILPGGIVLVEKITNVYGQVEYLETVIPISSSN